MSTPPYVQPDAAPAHQCLNVSCGCNDLVSAGPCSEWCGANTTEAADVETGKAALSAVCGCGHGSCADNRGGMRGTPERGLS